MPSMTASLNFKRETSEKEDENVAQPQHLDTQLFQIEIMLPHEDIADDDDTSQASVETSASDNNTDQSVEEPIEEIRTSGNERAICASSTDVVQFETPFELTTHVELDEKTYPHDNIQTCPQFDKEDQSHEKTAKSSNERNWQLCVTCGKLVKNLKYHMGTHASDIASYACPHCPMKMRNQTNLARHIQARSRHGIGETYQCETCLKTFKQPSGYKKHVSQAHNNERNFVCAVCGKPFKDK
uniref:C2H2-type domain-containing protein n=1 Tax=Anopheles culicifacies TaxID=139723 RepID=A0A182MP91_9DIPT